MGILNDILQQSILEFLWISSFAGILVGTGLLLRPKQLAQLNQYFSRWIGNADALGLVLDRPRWIERIVYRYHRAVGVSVTICSLLVLYTFLFSYNLRTISTYVPRDYWWLSDALMSIMLIGTLLAAVVGLIVFVRPSLLRDIEKSLNRWFSTEHLLAFFNGMYGSAEQSLFRHNRVAGISVLLGSCYVLIVLGYFLFWGTGKL